MKLGEVIKKYRKEKQMTQEEMANYLGVSAPAVNKWERGVSLPDITLLAPIARLFGITTDMLLSFREELTEQEIQQILKQLEEKIKTDVFNQTFQWAMEMVNEYPNCEKLAYSIGQILDSYRYIVNAPEPEQYDGAISQLYERALCSSDQDIVQAALTALFCNHLSHQEYEQAQHCLDQIPRKRGNPNSLQAALYAKQGKKQEAYELYERLLLSGHGELQWALQGLCSMALKDNDTEKAEGLIQKQENLAKVLELGSYMEASPRFELALLRKDKEVCLDILDKMIHGMGEIPPYGASDLYSHIRRTPKKSSTTAFMLKKGFEEDESTAFLKDDRRYQALMRELEVMAAQREE